MNAVQLYAFGDKRQRIVKIGMSREQTFVRKRAHENRGHEDIKMVIFGAWWGMQSDEHYLKEHFKHLAYPRRKEWFECDDELADWLKKMCKSGFVAKSQPELDAAPFVDSQHWLPGKIKFGTPEYIKNKQMRLPLEEIDDDDRGVWSDIIQSYDKVGDGDYYSPETFVEPARIAFGGQIDLDPASCHEADKVVKAIRYYSWSEDGLTRQWFGRVFLNPPYSQWDLWGDKLVDEMGSGRVSEAIVVVESRATTAKYFFKTARLATAYLLVNGRHKFWGPKASTADEGHALLYFGPSPHNFAKAYSLIGKTFFDAAINQ